MAIWSRITGLFGGNATSDTVGQQFAFPNSQAIRTPLALSQDGAMQVSAVWACVRLLSETLSSLPLNVYENTPEGRKISAGNLHQILHNRPNSRMTSIEFRETMQLNLCLHGNAYARIDRNGGQVTALWPLAASQMEVSTLQDGSLVYEYHRENDVAVFSEDNILHIKLFGNGVVGLSPLAYARTSIGMAAAAEQYSAQFFQNGGKPSGILTMDQILTKDQREQIRSKFKSMAEGTENAHRLMVLEAGMKYQAIQINPEDMQMLETRRFQIEDIARFFGVPSFLINDTEKTTTWGSGIEQMMLGFYQLNLRPYLMRWEQAMHKKLLSPTQRGRFDIEFNFEGLLRGDSAGRAQFYSQMVQNGLMTRNEVRRKENMPIIPGGDALTAQTNLSPLDQLGANTNGN